MEEKMGFWNKLHKSKKWQVIFFVVSMAVTLAVYLPCLYFVKTSRTNELLQSERTSEDIKIATRIVQVNEKGKKIEVEGWAVRSASTIVNGHVVLQPLTDSDAKVLKTTLTKRSDMENKMDVDWNAGMSGFVAEIAREKLEENICYEILYAFDYEIENEGEVELISTKVSTKQYVYNNQLYNFNPENYVSPNIVDDTIQAVLDSGYVCGFDIEKKIWLYQYSDQLYLIVGNDLYAEWDGNIEVPYHLWTTQADKLPEHRIPNGFDNRDFRFSANELDISSEEYHVAVTSIPQEYPITNIRLGIFDSQKNEWIWRVDFFPEVN